MTNLISRRGRIQAAPSPGGLTPSLAAVLAIACGVLVANNYYAQPMLPALAAALHTSSSVIGLCAMAGQFGYALGLVLLVPLGDKLPCRPLITVMLTIDTAALGTAALARDVGMILPLLALAGLTSAAISILVPMASALARPEQRGRAVGVVMTGILTGILLARTVAGGLEQLAGWRLVYGLAAAATGVVAIVLWRCLPYLPPNPALRYRALLGSIGVLIRTQPFLRRRMAHGAVIGCCLQLLWTGMPFLLAGPAYSYGAATIGAFGIVGVTGALAARPIGRLHDRGLARQATGVLLAALLAAWAIALRGHHLPLLIATIVLLDLAISGINTLNQSRVYTYSADLRSRVTTAYMTSYFFGGAIGAALAAPLYTSLGWSGVCAAGAAVSAAGIAVWATDRTRASQAED